MALLRRNPNLEPLEGTRWREQSMLLAPRSGCHSEGMAATLNFRGRCLQRRLVTTPSHASQIPTIMARTTARRGGLTTQIPSRTGIIARTTLARQAWPAATRFSRPLRILIPTLAAHSTMARRARLATTRLFPPHVQVIRSSLARSALTRANLARRARPGATRFRSPVPVIIRTLARQARLATTRPFPPHVRIFT
jgi:hypothetical protein